MNELIAGMAVLSLGLTAGVGAAAAECERTPEIGPDFSLRALADFPVGVAVPAGPWPNSLLSSRKRQALVDGHFSSITAENIMKMAYLQPEQGTFTFEDADALVDHAWSHDMLVHGHALVWHRQAPDWMNKYEGTKQDFAGILRRHVQTVARHFAGRIESWDVVNEAFEDDEPTEYRKTIWYDNIGPEYIELAFRTARQADPHADLYYNDYDISGALGPGKLDRILEMVDDFLARRVPIDGVGFQMHIDTDVPEPDELRAAFARVVDRGIKVRISELDVSVNQSRDYVELTPELAQLQRQRYADVVRIYREEVPKELRGGITVWGITDADSWIPGFRDRPDWPLLFDAGFNAKPALAGMAEGLSACTK